MNEADLFREKSLARCSLCKAVFRLKGKSGASNTEREEVALPKDISVRQTDTELVLEHRWFTPQNIVNLIPILFVTCFSLIFFLIVIDTSSLFHFLLFLPLFALPSLGIYVAIIGFINKTIIKANSEILEVTIAPLPWFGGNVFSSIDLKQLYIVETLRSYRLNVKPTYNILAKTRKGKSVTILSGVRNVNAALYIEQQIEKLLSIKDEPVSGEMSREVDPLRDLSTRKVLTLLLKGDLFNKVAKNILRRKK